MRQGNYGNFSESGAGFSISDAARDSELDQWVGEILTAVVKDWPKEVMLWTVMFMTAFVTEVASNAAVASVFIPLTITLSYQLNPKLHPLYLTLPAGISCSYAFMLPGEN